MSRQDFINSCTGRFEVFYDIMYFFRSSGKEKKRMREASKWCDLCGTGCVSAKKVGTESVSYVDRRVKFNVVDYNSGYLVAKIPV